MKKSSISSLVTFAIVICCILIGCRKSTNNIDTEGKEVAYFNEELAIPNFTISTIKDSTDFNSSQMSKDGIILIKYFSTDCDNCQEEAEHYFNKKDSLSNIRTIWISGDWSQLELIKEFSETYKLNHLNPIAIGKETSRFLLSHYSITGVPFAAVYKDNQLIKEYVGTIEFDELIAINNGNFNPDDFDSKDEESIKDTIN